jgi:hypothetical protein
MYYDNLGRTDAEYLLHSETFAQKNKVIKNSIEKYAPCVVLISNKELPLDLAPSKVRKDFYLYRGLTQGSLRLIYADANLYYVLEKKGEVVSILGIAKENIVQIIFNDKVQL